VTVPAKRPDVAGVVGAAERDQNDVVDLEVLGRPAEPTGVAIAAEDLCSIRVRGSLPRGGRYRDVRPRGTGVRGQAMPAVNGSRYLHFLPTDLRAREVGPFRKAPLPMQSGTRIAPKGSSVYIRSCDGGRGAFFKRTNGLRQGAVPGVRRTGLHPEGKSGPYRWRQDEEVPHLPRQRSHPG
jgi:hypothetical protein